MVAATQQISIPANRISKDPNLFRALTITMAVFLEEYEGQIKGMGHGDVTIHAKVSDHHLVEVNVGVVERHRQTEIDRVVELRLAMSTS